MPPRSSTCRSYYLEGYLFFLSWSDSDRLWSEDLDPAGESNRIFCPSDLWATLRSSDRIDLDAVFCGEDEGVRIRGSIREGNDILFGRSWIQMCFISDRTDSDLDPPTDIFGRERLSREEERGEDEEG